MVEENILKEILEKEKLQNYHGIIKYSVIIFVRRSNNE